jgi:hypothetical protein
VKKGSELTAKDLAEQLKADPVYQAKLKAQAERTERVRVGEVELLRGLALRGYPADSLQELVERHVPLPEDLSESLLEGLAAIPDTALQEAVVRALGAARAPFDVQPLVRLFEKTPSEPLRWAIANTLAELRPLGIRQWLLDAVQNAANGKAREMLALAVARTNPADVANRVLLGLLDEMPGHAARALAESGTAAERRVLQARLVSAKGWVKKEIDRAVRAISQRV